MKTQYRWIWPFAAIGLWIAVVTVPALVAGATMLTHPQMEGDEYHKPEDAYVCSGFKSSYACPYQEYIQSKAKEVKFLAVITFLVLVYLPFEFIKGHVVGFSALAWLMTPYIFIPVMWFALVKIDNWRRSKKRSSSSGSEGPSK